MSSTAILQECTGRSCGLCKTALDTAKSPPARPSHRTPEQPGPAFAAPTASPRFVAASSTASRSGRRGGQAGLGGSGKGAGGGGGGALAQLARALGVCGVDQLGEGAARRREQLVRAAALRDASAIEHRHLCTCT